MHLGIIQDPAVRVFLCVNGSVVVKSKSLYKNSLKGERGRVGKKVTLFKNIQEGKATGNHCLHFRTVLQIPP